MGDKPFHFQQPLYTACQRNHPRRSCGDDHHKGEDCDGNGNRQGEVVHPETIRVRHTR